MDLRTRLGHGCNIGGVAARILKLFKSPFSSNASAVFTAFDFAAINVIPLDVWFIIPGLMINLGILLTPGKPDSKYYEYEEALALAEASRAELVGREQIRNKRDIIALKG